MALKYLLFFMNPSISIDGESYCKNCQAIADTGNSLLSGPKREIDKIQRKIGAVYNDNIREFTVNCSNINSLPSNL